MFSKFGALFLKGKKKKKKAQQNVNVLFFSKPQSCLDFLEILEI